MCDVPSTAVFCSESIECFPGMAPKFCFNFCYYSVAPIITGMITHLMFHIRCILLLSLLSLITFMQGIYNYTPETNHVPTVYSVAAVL
jgi:hypothetical protein